MSDDEVDQRRRLGEPALPVPLGLGPPGLLFPLLPLLFFIFLFIFALLLPIQIFVRHRGWLLLLFPLDQWLLVIVELHLVLLAFSLVAAVVLAAAGVPPHEGRAPSRQLQLHRVFLLLRPFIPVLVFIVIVVIVFLLLCLLLLFLKVPLVDRQLFLPMMTHNRLLTS
jgi:hypothetical protein